MSMFWPICSSKRRKISKLRAPSMMFASSENWQRRPPAARLVEPPASSPRSMSTMSSTPAFASSYAVAVPIIPPPMMTTDADVGTVWGTFTFTKAPLVGLPINADGSGLFNAEQCPRDTAMRSTLTSSPVVPTGHTTIVNPLSRKDKRYIFKLPFSFADESCSLLICSGR